MSERSGNMLNESFRSEIFRRYSVKVPPQKQRVTRTRSKSGIQISSGYESLDYDIWENELLVREEQNLTYRHIVRINIARWVLYFLIGLITGCIAILIDMSIEHATTFKYQLLKSYLNDSGGSPNLKMYLYWYSSVFIPVFLGTVIVIYIEPGAAGSGLPSVISHLNGVRIPSFTKWKVLLIKIVSVICSCVAGLAGGKEGPFIHIGSLIGGLITTVRMPSCRFFGYPRYFTAEREKRDLMVGGCAAGVSAAFGSPVGATLMSLEEGTSFWSVGLMWKIFFCSIVSCFSFNTVFSLVTGYTGQRAYLGLFYFGKFNESTIEFEYLELPIFVGMGTFGGILGALLIAVNRRLALLRMKYMTTKLRKLMDAMVVSFLTATIGILSMQCLSLCHQKPPPSDKIIQMNCTEDNYNEMSIFWFTTQESILRMLFHSPTDSFSMDSLLAFCGLYFMLVVITLGINISAGIFIPSLLLGATWGRIIGLMLHWMFPNESWAIPAKYSLLGAAAHLGGVTRITISLTVVIIEATGTLQFGFPLMVMLFTSKWVGDFFTPNIYESQISLLGIPILPTEPPPLTSDILARDLMNKVVYVFPTLVRVCDLLDTLQQVAHHGFPVVKETAAMSTPNEKGSLGFRTYGQLRGFILRSQLITLLMTKSLQPPLVNNDVSVMLNIFRSSLSSQILSNDVEFTEEEREMKLDLRPYMNPSPYAVRAVTSYPRVFRLFRNLGLRHVIVTDNKNEVVGLITRKDLAKYKLWRHATSMGLKELKVY